MIIRHSLVLLEQLHELETQIHKWERFAHEKGVTLESEAILKIALLEMQGNNSSRALTGVKQIS